MPLHGAKNLRGAKDKKVVHLNNNVKGIWLTGLSNIAIETPVDEGRARNGWFFSEDAPLDRLPKRASKGGADSLSRLSKMPNYVLGKTFYFANNLPYINRLNYTDWALVPGTRGWVNREVTQMQIAIRRIK